MKDAKDIFCEAMLQLLQKKPFEEIKVKEILERAGLNKSSYYYHFSRLEDVVELIIERFIQGMRQSFIDSLGPLGPQSQVENGGYLVMEPFYEYFYENRRTYVLLSQNRNFGKEFWSRQYHGVMDYAGQLHVVFQNEGGTPYILPQKERDYYWSLATYQMLAAVEVWSKHDFEESPHEVAVLNDYLFRHPASFYYMKNTTTDFGLPVCPWQQMARGERYSG